MPAIALRLALLYAAIFFVSGVQLPFGPVWLAARGLSPAEIGAVLGMAQWIKVAANPLAGLAADRGRDQRRLMVALGAAALAGFLLLLPAGGFAVLLLLYTATAACFAPLLPLSDAVTLAAAYAGKLDYGRVRLWGSLGFIGATMLAGRLLAGGDADIVLYLLIVGALAVVAGASLLPALRPAARRPERAAWRQLLTPRFLAFLGTATAIQGSHGIYYAFGTLYWRSLGVSDATIGLLWAEGVIAEIALFYWGAPLLRRLGPLGLLALGGGSGVLRWTMTPLVAAVPLLALLQLLHAFTFGAAHLGAMHHLARSIASDRTATAQALYSATTGGIGSGFIMLGAGALYGTMGGTAYLAMAMLAAIGTAAALMLSATKS
jgi:PPP family 3-phenylpropionic acid transporter